ncbi:MAG TPA: DUF4292 domain-containing protein [Myxococcaceae bacterium]|nr:DUF4292 domain-containing protein [Myxococcaceae bacterium]
MKKCLLLILPLVPLALGCPKRVSLSPTGEVPDARRLLELSVAASTRVSSVNGEAKLAVDSPELKGQVTLFVAAARPARVHLQSLDFFGRPQASLTSDGERFGLLQAQEGRYYRGPPSPQNLARFLPVAIPPADLVALLLGDAPRVADEAIRVEEDLKAGAYVLTLTRGETTQRLWLDPRTHRAVRSEVRGRDAYDLSFEDFQESGTLSFPRRVVLSAPALQTKLELRYTEVTLNDPPDPALFTPEAPEGVPVIEVDESGQPRA